MRRSPTDAGTWQHNLCPQNGVAETRSCTLVPRRFDKVLDVKQPCESSKIPYGGGVVSGLFFVFSRELVPLSLFIFPKCFSLLNTDGFDSEKSPNVTVKE